MDETLIGFGDGTWINGSHWYSDPFYLYSDYSIDHYYELSFYDTYMVPSTTGGGGQYQQDMFFLYSAISSSNTTPIIDPVPVPEPSCFGLFLAATFAIILYNKVLTRKRR